MLERIIMGHGICFFSDLYGGERSRLDGDGRLPGGILRAMFGLIHGHRVGSDSGGMRRSGGRETAGVGLLLQRRSRHRSSLGWRILRRCSTQQVPRGSGRTISRGQFLGRDSGVQGLLLSFDSCVVECSNQLCGRSSSIGGLWGSSAVRSSFLNSICSLAHGLYTDTPWRFKTVRWLSTTTVRSLLGSKRIIVVDSLSPASVSSRKLFSVSAILSLSQHGADRFACTDFEQALLIEPENVLIKQELAAAKNSLSPSSRR